MSLPESGIQGRAIEVGIIIPKPDISVYRKCFARACEYLNVTQERLRNGYRWDDSGQRAFCVGIAREVAEILLPIGPSILEVLGERADGLHNERLIPKCYEGTDNGFGQRVTWVDHHLICALDDVIFDPIVGKPIDAHLYRTTVFESPVLLNTHVPANEIAAYLENPSLWHSRKKIL